MKIINTKVMKGFSCALLFVVVVLAIAVAMRKEIAHVYNSQKYHEEVTYIEKYLHIIVTGDDEKIREIFSPDSLWLERQGAIDSLKELVPQIYDEKIKIQDASERKEDSREVRFFRVYFNNDLRTSIDIKLVKDLVKDKEWLIDSVMLSDEAFTLLQERGLIDKDIM